MNPRSFLFAIIYNAYRYAIAVEAIDNDMQLK